MKEEGGVKKQMSTDEETKSRPTPLDIAEFAAPSVAEVQGAGAELQGAGAEPAVEATTKPKKAPRVKKDASEKKKRGPARPHRRLTDEVLDSRIEKLRKRFDKAKSQLEEAGRHLGGYDREKQMRESDGAAQN